MSGPDSAPLRTSSNPEVRWRRQASKTPLLGKGGDFRSTVTVGQQPLPRRARCVARNVKQETVTQLYFFSNAVQFSTTLYGELEVGGGVAFDESCVDPTKGSKNRRPSAETSQ